MANLTHRPKAVIQVEFPSGDVEKMRVLRSAAANLAMVTAAHYPQCVVTLDGLPVEKGWGVREFISSYPHGGSFRTNSQCNVCGEA